MLGRPFWSAPWWAGPAGSGARVERWCRQAVTSGAAVREITGYRTAEGRERLVDLTLQPVLADGPVPLLFCTGLDVTDRVDTYDAAARDVSRLRDVEENLSRELARSERVLDHVADGLYGLDVEGRVEFVNRAAVKMTGFTAEEQLGYVQHTRLHGRYPDGSEYPVEQCPVWRALRTGRTVVAEHETFWRADGTPLEVELVAAPVLRPVTAGGAEEVAGVVVSFRDLTERLAARRQQAELGRLAERAATQRALSDRLQQALLTPPPQPPGLQLEVRYAPAESEAQVGGDWYDAFLQPDGSTTLVIGDVVGHDDTAAAAMGQLRGLLRALAYGDDAPLGRTLTRVERTAQGLAVGTLATAVLARVHTTPDGARLRWTNAGHPPPVLLTADGARLLLTDAPDLMLGVDSDTGRHDAQAPLPTGSTLVLFTDGLVERRGASLDDGLARLLAAVAELGDLPLDELCDTLLTRMTPGEQEDDVALVAVRVGDRTDRPPTGLRPPGA